eukprot:7173493-Pyramimonas_sp.AAC.1
MLPWLALLPAQKLGFPPNQRTQKNQRKPPKPTKTQTKAVLCGVVRCCAVLCGALECCAVLRGAVRCRA